MRKILVWASIAFFSATAFGEGEMHAPKPSDEIKALAKSMLGVWKCDGKSKMADGKEVTYKNKATFTSELDGFVVAGKYEGMNKVMARDFTAYDSETKMFTRSSYDAFGGVSSGTAKGKEGGVITWTLKGSQMGSATEETQTVTDKGPKEVLVTGTQKGPGAENVTYELKCKK